MLILWAWKTNLHLRGAKLWVSPLLALLHLSSQLKHQQPLRRFWSSSSPVKAVLHALRQIDWRARSNIRPTSCSSPRPIPPGSAAWVQSSSCEPGSHRRPRKLARVKSISESSREKRPAKFKLGHRVPSPDVRHHPTSHLPRDDVSHRLVRQPLPAQDVVGQVLRVSCALG